MNVEKIVFATDFSDASQAALKFASSLAHDGDALLYIVHVGHSPGVYVPGFGPAPGPYGYVPEFDNLQQVRERLRAVAPTIPDVRWEHRYLEGDAPDEIVDFARRQNIDLIVMGTHGRRASTTYCWAALPKPFCEKRTARC